MITLDKERACILGEYIFENGATVRQAAKKYNVSKSTVHKDMTNWNTRKTLRKSDIWYIQHNDLSFFISKKAFV